MDRRWSFAAGVLMLVPCVAAGQTIRGVVMQAESGGVIRDARIEVPFPGRPSLFATSDSMGSFLIAVPGPGRFVLRVSHISYTPLETDSVDVGFGENVTLEVRLGTSPIEMSPLVVTSYSRARANGFYDRMRRLPGGNFMTRADIEMRGGSRMSDLLRTMPGVTIVRVPRGGRRGGPAVNLIALRGSTTTQCEPSIYLDGAPIQQTPETTLDDLIMPDQIDAVEAYPTNAGAPPQFVEPGRCGVLLFWSRVQLDDGGPALTLKRALMAAAGIMALVLLVR